MNELPHITNALEREDIQGIILRGYESLKHASFVLLAIRPGGEARARQWLQGIDVRDAMPFDKRKAGMSQEQCCVNLAFSYEGIMKLVPDGAKVEGFSRPFMEGMVTAHRTRVLGDFDDSAPRSWVWGGPQNAKVDILLMVYAASDERLRFELATLIGVEEQQRRHGIQEIKTLETNYLKGRKEHFGFRDGIAQPVPAGKTGYQTVEQAEKDYRRPNQILPGEFLMGYLNEHKEMPLSATLARSDDPLYQLRETPDEHHRPDLGHNGSYLVLRTLAQDVRGFWEFCEKNADKAPPPDKQNGHHVASNGHQAGNGYMPEDPEHATVLVGAKMVGRWPNGVPLMTAWQKDMPHYEAKKVKEELGDDPGPIDEEEAEEERKKLATEEKRRRYHWEYNQRNFDSFAYAEDDPDGLRAPFASHIRRVNPRDSLVESPHQSLNIVKHHRMLRRGRAYGLPLDKSMEPSDFLKVDPDSELAKQDRGLHFMCFNADIARQFEFVQQMWMSTSKFHGLREEVSRPGQIPLQKNPGQPESAVFTIPETPVRAKLPNFSDFITVRGGGYFFMPSIRALNFLSGKNTRRQLTQATAVFSGGGVKAIAFAGAISEAEKRGIEWKGFAGTSGGAIVATLLAAGYKSNEIYDYMCGKFPEDVRPLLEEKAKALGEDPKDVKMTFPPSSIARRRALFRVPVLSPLINAVAHLGMYDSYNLEETLRLMLKAKKIETWEQLRVWGKEREELGTDYKLQLIATDLTNRRAIILPQDLHQYDLDPDAQSVAYTVRMSMSIPGFFEPVVLPYTNPKIVIVDGGLVSSFPVWVFKQDKTSTWPTLGFFLNDGPAKPHRIRGLGGLAWGAMSSGWSSLDKVLADRFAEGRTMSINVRGLPTISRTMKKKERRELWKRGVADAAAFFSKVNAPVTEEDLVQP